MTVEATKWRHARIAAFTRSRGGRSSILGLAVGMATLLPFVLAPVRARWLGPDARGGFAFFQSSLMVISSVGTLGVRYAAYSLEAAGPDRFRFPMRRTILWGTGVGLACAVPLAVVGALAVSPLVGLAALSSVTLLPGWIIFHLELANAQMLGRDRRTAIGVSGTSLSEFLLNLLTVLTHTMSLFTSVIATLTSELIRVSASARWRRSDRKLDVSPDLPNETSFSKMSLGFAPASISPVIAANIDVLMYGALLPIKVVGLYVVAKLGFSLYLPVSGAIEGRIISVASKLGTRRTLQHIALGGAGLGLGISAAAAILIPALFGPAYLDAVWAVPVACLAGILRLMYGAMVLIAAREQNIGSASIGSHVLIATTTIGATLLWLLGFESLAPMMSLLLTAQCLGLLSLLLHRFMVQRREDRIRDEECNT